MHIRIARSPLLFAALLGGAAVLLSCDRGSPLTAPPPAAKAMNAMPSELAYYNGVVYEWQSPAGTSNDPNQLVRACFMLGPDVNGHPSGPAGRLYAIVAPGATQHACPDGTRRHDHVLSAVPGVSGYTPHWHLLNVVPGANFTIAIMPLTSEAAVLAAAAAGQVQIIDTGVTIIGPVLGPVRP